MTSSSYVDIKYGKQKNRTLYLNGLSNETGNSLWDTGSKRLFELANVLLICHAVTCGVKAERVP